PSALSFPVGNVALDVWVDGAQRPSLEAAEVQPAFTYDDGCTQIAYGSAYLGDNTSLSMESYKDCVGNEYSYVTASRYVYDETYFSTVYDKYLDETFTDGPYHYAGGTFINPATSVSTRFVIDVDEGQFGGNAELTEFFEYNYFYPFDYVYEWGYDRGFQLDETRNSAAYGVTTP
ncbi:MAG: hypothetical protein ACXW3Z_01110, partial [Limisphaerales bacterium]